MKLLIVLLVLLVTSPCFAKDYWVYVALTDKSSAFAANDVEVSKRGDIIAIIPAVEGQVPAKKELEHFLIFVVSDLTKTNIDLITSGWGDVELDNGVPKDISNKQAFRKYKVDISQFTNKKRGFVETKINKTQFLNGVNIKTQTDLDRYSMNRWKAYAKRPFLLLRNKFSPKPAYAATISKLCAVGGNCTDEDYNTCSTWEAATDNDLVTATNGETAELYNDDGDFANDYCIVAGATTNATYYRTITAASSERHDGTEGSGAVLTGSNGFSIVELGEDYAVASWFEITGNATSGLLRVKGTGVDEVLVHNMIIHDATSSTASDVDLYQLDSAVASYDDFYLYNSIFYDSKGSASCIETEDGELRAYNNSTTGCNIGIDCDGDAQEVYKNNIAVGNTTDFSGCSGGTYDYNLSQDDTAPGTNSLKSSNLDPDATCTTEFDTCTDGSQNLHLVSGANSIDAGEGLGDGTFDTDIDGRDRDTEGDTWDIGADEFVSAAAPVFNQLIINITKLIK